MDNDDTTGSIDLRPVTKIVASYVGHHTIVPEQLSALIVSVQQVIRQLGKPVQPEPARMPAVPIRRSVRRDHVVCLECGFKGKTLRRHLGPIRAFLRGPSPSRLKRRLLCHPRFIEGLHELAPFSPVLRRWHDSVTTSADPPMAARCRGWPPARLMS